MLDKLDTKVHKIPCVDEIDETMGSRRWSKRSAEQLQKLNKDCNLTAGLEAELVIAVGARVMLRRNIDTKHGLVNGAIGTVIDITYQHVIVKFDHITEPCALEMVRSKFLLLKSFHIYQKQFPLILAYAVTIHKCQGLSLDCAIVDLSSKVFCAGMAYVALSRVRSLDGLYLTAFDASSIIVSSASLEEANRLRSLYRSDLPCYEIPKKNSRVKRTFSYIMDESSDAPKPKKPKLATHSKHVAGTKRVRKSSTETVKKKATDDCVITNTVGVGRTEYPNFCYYQVNENWQLQTCERLGLTYTQKFTCQCGSPDTILTRPDLRSLKQIAGDGNCLFRAVSYIITGSERQHSRLRDTLIGY